MHVVIEFHKAFEHLCLVFLGNTGTSVLAVHIESVAPFALLISVAYLDMSLLGVLHGIGHEVGDDLLHAPTVEGRDKRVVGVVCNKLHLRVLHALGEDGGCICKHLGKVHLLGGDLYTCCLKRGDGEYVIHQPEQHVTVVHDHTDDLLFLFRGRHHGQHV